jgi:hypothetical protein
MALATIGKLKNFSDFSVAKYSSCDFKMVVMKNTICMSFAFALSLSNVVLADPITESKEAIKAGKISCLTPLPELGCESYSKITFKNGMVYQTDDVIFTVQPTAVAFVEYEPTPIAELDVNSYCRSVSRRLERTVKFRAVGRELSEIELSMFKTVYEERMGKIIGQNVCLEPVETEKGLAFKLLVDGRDIGRPPLYLSWHMPKDLPPLIGGAATIIKFDE